MQYEASVITYFKNKADKYDLVDDQSYWQLSDEVLWEVFQKHLSSLPPKFSFLDAGGGTGRWSTKALEEYKNATGEIIDLSAEMLAVAKKKAQKRNIADRLKFKQGNLNQSLKGQVSSDQYNLAFNFHNVIGFLDKPTTFIKKLAGIVKKNGLVITLVPNLYHAVYFNISIGKVAEASKILKTKKGRFTDDMPDIHFFTPDQISSYYQKAGLEVVQMTGFPAALYPGFWETQIEGETTSLSNLLESKERYQEILAIEKQLLQNDDIAARGNNIFIVGKKI